MGHSYDFVWQDKTWIMILDTLISNMILSHSLGSKAKTNQNNTKKLEKKKQKKIVSPLLSAPDF